ncbi:Hsp20/alpha crystallin family protein [Candidatus Gracilibacteria bacterium]|nr:Hsp20/alpha crystallin family protein [Candidatus Gracilibacteria bacterium]NJM85962.1 Hsp20/alpha crystallin family protein [Hydrococcus sp. RU_2_2]NJP17620.1 Hsp20/alpha crystallin family protein [Hydrococcus sp. CRU_1_1]
MTFDDDKIWCPLVDLVETDTALILRAEIPGVKIRDLDVRTTKNTISIIGKRREQHFSNEKELFSSQSHYGRLECLVHLPVSIQNERIEAELVDGILTLTMPKAQKQEVRQDKLTLFSA